jgi:hypothetical protein
MMIIVGLYSPAVFCARASRVGLLSESARGQQKSLPGGKHSTAVGRLVYQLTDHARHSQVDAVVNMRGSSQLFRYSGFATVFDPFSVWPT